MRLCDPDVNRKLYSVAEIAMSYQGSHVSEWNMPVDDELLYALRINGHDGSKLGEVKDEYRRLARLFGPQ